MRKLRVRLASDIRVMNFDSLTDPCHGLSEQHFAHLEECDKNEIRRLIARISEKSFRRGFQQGYDSHKRGDELCDLHAWRFSTDLDYAVSAHGTYHSTADERLETECHVSRVGFYVRQQITDGRTWGDILAKLFRVRSRRSMSAKKRFEVLRRDGFRCKYCGVTASESQLHVDHVIPVVAGGSDDLSNLVTACAGCNLGKGKTCL